MNASLVRLNISAAFLSSYNLFRREVILSFRVENYRYFYAIYIHIHRDERWLNYFISETNCRFRAIVIFTVLFLISRFIENLRGSIYLTLNACIMNASIRMTFIIITSYFVRDYYFNYFQKLDINFTGRFS